MILDTESLDLIYLAIGLWLGLVTYLLTKK